MDLAKPTAKNTPDDADNDRLDVSGSDRTVAAGAEFKASPDDKTLSANMIQNLQSTDQPQGRRINPADGLLARDPESKYKVSQEIARGGMGLVMEAQDNNLRRNVAMKVLLNPQRASRQQVLRFIQEARITSQLQHPGIVPIHELGIDSTGNVFYTMKRISGQTLKVILAGLKENNSETAAMYPLNRLLNVLMRVCEAMAYAHSMGIVHRDLKPENIMIGEYGEVLVMDWGLAKLLDKMPQSQTDTEGPRSDEGNSSEIGTPQPEIYDNTPRVDPDAADPLITTDGNVVGTPGYMAPEQARGQVSRTDERADVYALGSILYHILKLEPTVEIKTVSDRKSALDKIRSGKIEPLQESSRATKPLIAITMKALSLRPKDRYRSARSFKADLEAYMDGFATSAEAFSAPTLIKLFVLRHKVITSFSLAMLILVIAALSVNYRERLRAQEAEKTAVIKGEIAENALSNLKATAPALISLVDYHVQQQEIQKALGIAEQAATLVPESADCHITKGNLLQLLNRFPEAIAAFETALKLAPANKTAAVNLALCRQALVSNDIQKLTAALWEQSRFDEARYHILSTLDKQNPEMVKSLLKRMLAVAGIQYRDIQLDQENRCSLDLSNSSITDLSPLKPVPLTRLDLTGCTGVYDLLPLKGMHLQDLRLNGCNRITSLEPLHGMPLTRLELHDCTSIIDLQTPNQKTRKKTSPAPFKNMPLTGLDLSGCTQVNSLLFLKQLPLKHLKISGCTGITDLSPLKGMHLTRLDLDGCTGITNSPPLRGMKLIEFNCNDCTGIVDYSTLQNMPAGRFLGGGRKKAVN